MARSPKKVVAEAAAEGETPEHEASEYGDTEEHRHTAQRHMIHHMHHKHLARMHERGGNAEHAALHHQIAEHHHQLHQLHTRGHEHLH